jgi:hypothetical protein
MKVLLSAYSCCYAGGFVTGESGAGSADYVAFIGNIAYDAAAGNYCYSNIDVYEPLNFDTLPGTHIYIAGNFSFGALNTPNCNGGFPASDGEGINIDSLNVSGGKSYSGQVVVDNNIVVANGGRGLEAEYNYEGSTNATVYFRHNTSWGNNQDATQNAAAFVPELGLWSSYNTTAYLNLVMPTEATLVGGTNPVYSLMVLDGNGTDQLNNNFVYSAAGNNTNATTSPDFSFGTNTIGTNPAFANPVAPGSPSCGSFASVPACMATVIANFSPTNASAVGSGYQIPSAVPTYDPLFPQWLCNVNLPPGLVTLGCLALSSLPASVTITGVSVK